MIAWPSDLQHELQIQVLLLKGGLSKGAEPLKALLHVVMPQIRSLQPTKLSPGPAKSLLRETTFITTALSPQRPLRLALPDAL